MSAGAERGGVPLTNLDQPLFDGADATKRDLVDYLDAVCERILPVLRDRPLSVIRVLRGQAPFMQKNLPKYTPDWVRSVSLWAESSHREVTYALCNDRRTLLWFANQRAIEYHPTLVTTADWEHPSHLIMDIDPPSPGQPSPGQPSPGQHGPGQPGPGAFGLAVQAAHLVREALAGSGLDGAVKTSGAKGVHVFVPLDSSAGLEDVAAATRAIAARAERIDPALATTAFIREDRAGKVFLDSTRAGGATVAAAYSPRIRPGAPVSFPVPWDDLDQVAPADFTVHTAPALLAAADPWADLMPPAQTLPRDLIEEGHTIPIARVVAMHEGKRRARARRGRQLPADGLLWPGPGVAPAWAGGGVAGLPRTVGARGTALTARGTQRRTFDRGNHRGQRLASLRRSLVPGLLFLGSDRGRGQPAAHFAPPPCPSVGLDAAIEGDKHEQRTDTYSNDQTSHQVPASRLRSSCPTCSGYAGATGALRRCHLKIRDDVINI